jgi:hypothetical protein
MGEASSVLTFIDEGGAIAVLILIIFGLVTGRWIVPEYVYQAQVKRADKMEELAWNGVSLTDKALELPASSSSQQSRRGAQ